MKKRIIIIASCIVFLIVILLLINYFYVNNYDFKLNGSNIIKLNIGDTWEDPLYTVKDNKQIDIKNNINYNNEGEYQIDYILKIGLFKKILHRKIIIVNKGQVTDFVFNIKGDNPYYLMKDYNYIEMGYQAIDKIDGDISNQVIVTNNVKEDEGTYNIVYQITNSNGITKTITREVVVYSMKFKGSLKTEEYTKENEIIIDINDNNYSYTLLPNNEKNDNRKINYLVNENKLYTFKIYDKNNNYMDYNVNVNNIDNISPTGTCTYTLYDRNGEITVNAEDNVAIKGFEYIYGSNKTDILTSHNYTVNTLDNNASVIIYDKADNQTKINCKNIDKSSITTKNYSLQTFENRQYWFYVPNGVKAREKAPLVIYLHGGGVSNVADSVNRLAINKNIKDGKSFPYYVATPFYPSGYNLEETNNYVLKLINYLVNTHSIDPNRIVISGGSNGSDPAYYIAANNPNKFSSMIIIAGHNSITDLSKLTYLPIWFHQGSQDGYDFIQNYVNKLNAMGGNAKATQYPGGHSAPNDAFVNSQVTNWILTQTKK